MNKADLINSMSQSAGISKVQAGRAIDAAIATIQSALVADQKVVLAGFGTFYAADRSGRLGTHPKTGAKIRIDSRRVVKFKVGKQLSEAVAAQSSAAAK